MAKKSKLLVLLLSFTALYGFCIKAALSPPLPSPSNPLVFYSNQTRDDLRLVFKKSFTHAARSIDIWMYTAADSLLLSQLQKKAAQGTDIHIYYDKRGGTPDLPDLLHPKAVKSKGLMHRKIVIVDDATIYVGSANMTTSSLQLHDNLSVGLYDPNMAAFIKSPTAKTYTCDKNTLWLLPDLAALYKIKDKIDAAHHSIFVAMFTLTQTDLIEALIRAKNRGVQVKVALDRYTARGASKKAVEKLSAAGVELLYSSGLPLLHHKWAYIDSQELILGSTNWTEAAFRKNYDLLLFLNTLTPSHKNQIEALISAIEMESTK